MELDGPFKEGLIVIQVGCNGIACNMLLVVFAANWARDKICKGFKKLLGGPLVRISRIGRVAETDQVNCHPEKWTPNGRRDAYHSTIRVCGVLRTKLGAGMAKIDLAACRAKTSANLNTDANSQAPASLHSPSPVATSYCTSSSITDKQISLLSRHPHRRWDHLYGPYAGPRMLRSNCPRSPSMGNA